MGQTARQLDDAALDLFARKGHEGGPHVPQAGEANAVKLRRIMQLVDDLHPRSHGNPDGLPLEGLRILDLGCGEGLYAIEAGLRGAEVLALDARTERMQQGAECAARHGLGRVRFEQRDVRDVSREELGGFDVVFVLGILYHLDASDLLPWLERVHALCDGLLLVDTLVAPEAVDVAEYHGRRYDGQRVREHGDDDDPAARRARLLKSIDNTFSFRFTRPALVRALRDVGFTSVLEAHAPLEPGKAADRLTLAARRGTPVELAAYPWINGADEEGIAARISP